jgi:putative serine/threonine protein kinase
MLEKIRNKKFLGKGKRSIVYLGFIKNKKVTIKCKRPDTKARGRIKNEADWLKVLNKYGVGPKFIALGKDYLIYEFVEGEEIIDWIKKSNKIKVKKILKDIFLQCRTLDELKVTKGELHRPIKHILIKDKPRMIDFERCKPADKPKNVTQFAQFLMRDNIYNLLKSKDFKFDKKELIKTLKLYKKDYSKKNFKKILSFLN